MNMKKMTAGILTGLMVTAIASPSLMASSPFSDIEQSYAKDAILHLYGREIVHGTGEGQFSPADPMTREQFAKVLTGAKGLAPELTGEPIFSDAQEIGAWYFGYVQTAQKHGVMIGMGDGSFGVGQPLTREQAIAAIVKAASLESEVVEGEMPTFADADQISQWALGYVALAQRKGLVVGMGDNTFQGQLATTREMAVQMLYRYLVLEVVSEEPAPVEEETEPPVEEEQAPIEEEADASEDEESAEPAEGDEETDASEDEESTEPAEGDEEADASEDEESTGPAEGNEESDASEDEESSESAEGDEESDASEDEESSESAESDADSEDNEYEGLEINP